MTLGFIAASVAYSSWTAERTIFDPAATRGATNALLSTPTVHDMLAREIRTALRSSLGPTVDNAKLTKAINRAVVDPKFVGAFEDAIGNINQAILSGGHGRVTIDPNAVTSSLDAAVARDYPQIAPQVRRTKVVSVPIGSTSLPHLGNAERNVRRAGDIALALAILLIGGALALSPHRKTFRRAGRRVAFMAIGPVLVFAVAPRLLQSSSTGALAVTAAVLHAYAHRVLFSAAILAVVGTATWIIAVALPKRRDDSDQEPIAAPRLRPVYVRQSAPRAPVVDPMPEKLYL
jgi:hypothetical protein